ncbi:MAG: glycosyltransferase [Acidimicrobiales bacterium]
MPTAPVSLSVVVVAYAMERELPRTLRSLTAPYQRGIERGECEILVVDNGSPRPVAETLPAELASLVHIHRIDDAAPSPARAANAGLQAARGDLVGLIVDGARMASPGLLAAAGAAARVAPRVVVTAPAWHLGPGLQMHAEAAGYDQTVEDDLLDRAGWEADGYELFTIASPAASSARGLFGAMGESSSLFLPRELWAELGGLDERFALPGGGLVNHDLYRRACDIADARLVVLLGEGTFHQIHGGAATSGRVTRDEMRADYEAICGMPHRPPVAVPLYVGSVPRTYLPYLARSAEQAAP